MRFSYLTLNGPGASKLYGILKCLTESKTYTLYMDTDDLSREAYEGILIEAEKLTHDLTLHYGLLSYKCKNETEYIEKAEKLTRAIMEVKDYQLDDLFWGNPPDKERLDYTLKKILRNIEKVKSIPTEKRKYDF
jgi:hypothetical protein